VNERQLDKNAARRLAIIRHAREVTGNVALTCRYYGISRQVFYVWYRRYEAEGLAGLRDRVPPELDREPLRHDEHPSSEGQIPTGKESTDPGAVSPDTSRFLVWMCRRSCSRASGCWSLSGGHGCTGQAGWANEPCAVLSAA
jgi:transposase-like protein